MPVKMATENNAPYEERWEEKEPYKIPEWPVSDDIVISGFSGRFPECNNVEELKKNIFEGIDMVTEDDRRWKPGLSGTPKRMGKLKAVDQFDMLFFGVHGKQADFMDPSHRIFLEVAYEAIFDAGYEPSTFRGKNVGVFVGCSEAFSSGIFDHEGFISGYELLGMCPGMVANRASFALDFKGPSMLLNSGSSSTVNALNEAILAMRNNRCEAAIVGGSNITLYVSTSMFLARSAHLSQEGISKVFDNSANGYAKSEAVSAIFLQRASDARRCYATVLHCKVSNIGETSSGLHNLSSQAQAQLFRDVFGEIKLDPTDVGYIEAHGSSTIDGDREECNAIADFFCPGRNKPLLVGSVKSNMGHAEGASGICAIAKVLLSMEEEILPPNLHYNEPNAQVPALVEGKLKVVVEKTPWQPGIVATNNFDSAGSNGTVLLQANLKEKIVDKERSLPRLALACGRSEEGVQHIFNKIVEEKFTDEALALLEEACKAPTLGMRYRGYALVQKPGEELSPVIQNATIEKRPVWFLFSGMGSQWQGMAKSMMELSIFANSIDKSAKILKPLGVDLHHLLNDATEEELNHVVAPFVTIAAVQIALVDVVKALGIESDGIIGHSVGELGCAFADGCFTAEQMLLTAYWRGNSCAKTELIHGAMAAVGMTWEETQKRCPEGVFAVCHNAEDSVTISGPAEKVHKFVKELNAENIFARGVKTCDIAFHSRYVEPASHIMRKELAKVIPNPLPRSARWVSSSVPEELWAEPQTQLSSVEYHVNNLLSPVLFKEAMTKVPKNAIIIEFAPHSLLQAIVKRIIGPDCIYIGLMKRGSENSVQHCLSSIGRMYIHGLNPSASNLYEQVLYPVSRGTPMLNSLIKWNHATPVFTFDNDHTEKGKDAIRWDTVRGSPHEYILGHKIDGRILFPFMGYIELVWKTFARTLKKNYEELPVIIEDFSVLRATILPASGEYIFKVSVLDSDGTFCIVDLSSTIVATGRISQGDDNTLRMSNQTMCVNKKISNNNSSNTVLEAKDFYKELRLRGYEYGPTFQGVLRAASNGLSGKIKWDGHWVSFMDTMLQIPILRVPLRALLLPTRVTSIRIDPRKKPQDIGEEIDIEVNSFANVCRAGPVEVQGIHCGIAPKRTDFQNTPVLEKYTFVYHFDYSVLTEREKCKAEEYFEACSALLYKIQVGAENYEKEISNFLPEYRGVSDELSKEFLKEDNKRYAVLKILKDVIDDTSAKDLKEKVWEAFHKHSALTDHDFLGSQILNECSLRASLDVVQDNFFSRSLKILEISSCAVISRDVMKMLKLTTLGLLKVKYVIANLTLKEISENVVEPGMKIVNVDFQNGCLPEENDLVVSKELFTENNNDIQKGLRLISDALKPNGFVLLVERTSLSPSEKFIANFTKQPRKAQSEIQLEIAFNKTGLDVICKKNDDIASVMYLLRKRDVTTYALDPVIIQISNQESFSWVDDLKKAMMENEEAETKKKIWLLGNEPDSGLIGFVSCIKQEPGGRYIRCLFNSGDMSLNDISNFRIDNPSYKEVIEKDLLFNVKKNGRWGMFRHQLLETDPETKLKNLSFLNVTKRGDLSSFKWIENCTTNEFDSENVIPIEIYYSALNFRDIMLASGKLPPDAIPEKIALQECILGLECVGRDPTGRRVMGITLSKALATHICLHKDMLIDVPDFWTMEEACTVPVVYMTSYYALFVRGRMKPKESILIHSGTGGVGQAAISIALSMACQVFTTVGSKEKKLLLLSIFPELNEKHIFSSRDVMFEKQVLEATNGKGVDLVLNSLADDKFQASINCLKENGRFLEIGKYDIAMNSNLGMGVFSKNIELHGVFLDTVFEDVDAGIIDDLITLKNLLADGVKKGVVRPLKRNIYSWDRAEEAFRFMASGKHTGKVVLKIRDEEPENKVIPKPVWIPSDPRTYLCSKKSYLITGALGGFGFELATWLFERGARKLVLSGRSGIKNEYQRLWIHRWRNGGSQVLVSDEDITSQEGVKSLLNSAEEMGPVGGVFHLAMVLKDSLFENLSSEIFEEVVFPKARGVKHLDNLTRLMCPELDYFVAFSSISCGKGNSGQSNYGYANSVMERIIEQRKEEGLPGLAIQWGGIGDVGMVYEKMGGNEVILKGTIPQRLNSCLDVMDRFLQEDNAVVSSFVPLERAAFSSCSGYDIKTLLCKVLGIKDPSSVKPEMTLGELGMDSLMGVEIKQVLESEYDTVLSVPEVRQLNIKNLEKIGKNKKSDKSGTFSKTLSHSLAKENKIVSVMEMYIPEETLVSMSESTDSRCVFLIHPMEGHVKMLKTLASKIKCKVYGLQYSEDVPIDTIQDIAAFYIEKIRGVQPQGPYHIVGFSFGALITFEIATALQETDQVKNLICIEGSPDAVREGCKKHSATSGKNVQYSKEAMRHFLRHYFANIPKDIEFTILNSPEDDTSQHVKSLLPQYFGTDFDTAVAWKLGERVEKLCLAGKSYHSEKKFKGRVTLIRSFERDMALDLESTKKDDYELGRIVDGDVEVFVVKGGHHDIIEDRKNEVSKIINDRI